MRHPKRKKLGANDGSTHPDTLRAQLRELARPPDVGDDAADVVAAFVRRETARANIREAELAALRVVGKRTAAGPGAVAVLVGASDAARAAGARGRPGNTPAEVTAPCGQLVAAGACDERCHDCAQAIPCPNGCEGDIGEPAALLVEHKPGGVLASCPVCGCTIVASASVPGLSPRRSEDFDSGRTPSPAQVSGASAGLCAPHGRTQSSSLRVATRSTGTAPLPPAAPCSEAELITAMARNLADRSQLWTGCDLTVRRWAADVAAELLALAAELPADPLAIGEGEGVARG